MSAKRADKFLEQFWPDFGLFQGCFFHSKSVYETRCLNEHPPAPFREEKIFVSRTRYGVAHTPTKLTSHLRKRSCWLSASKREESRQTPHNEKMRKPAHRSSQLGEPIVKRASAVSYFHPLNSSFIAVSNAVFILFSIIYKIKASICACYFFLRFFSSSFWLI